MAIFVSVARPRVFVFAGPTLRDVGDGERRVRDANVTVLPPARRGDIDALVREVAPGVLALVDGRFHQCLAVGHAELRRAVERGWSVWGLSSMGAIRAYELRHLGMRGFGDVYRHFLADVDFQDDEVALLHEPEPPYTAVSEPLIHMRHFIRALETDGLLTCVAAHDAVRDLKARWYGARTLPRLRAILEAGCSSLIIDALRARFATFSQHRVKAADLLAFLDQRPWYATTSVPTPLAVPYGTPRPPGGSNAPTEAQ